MFRGIVPWAAAMICLTLWSCQESAPDGSSAEVPQAGPAVTDPGPAPEGQWEPGMEDPAASTEAPVDPAEDSTSPATDADAVPAEDSVSLKMQGWDETQQLIAGHQGKIVVVDFWSTSCLPCRREFPHLVALQRAYPEAIACVSVSLDFTGRKSRPPESYREAVVEFLQEQGAAIDNVLSTDDPDELEQRLGLAPIPLVWVLDRSGKRVRVFDNADLEGREFSYEADVVPFVETLLAETPDGANKSADSADLSLR